MGLFLISDIKGLCFGAEDVKAVYIGSEQVWPVGSLPEWIEFADPEVLRVLLANGVGDETGVTPEDVEKVTDIKTWFTKNTAVTSFNELQNFSSLVQIGSFRDTIDYRDGFYGCENLESVVLPENVETIGHYVFGKCVKLKMDLPQSIKSLGSGSFARVGRDREEEFVVNLPNLEKITPRTSHLLNATYYTFMNSGVTRVESLGNVKKLLAQGYFEGSEYYAMFSYCEKLTYANIDNVVSIGQYTFYKCTSLRKVDCRSLVNIGAYAFCFCSQLKEIVLPDSLTSIGNYAFAGYGNDANIVVVVNATIPPSMGDSSFSDTEVSTIYVPDESVTAYREASGWSAYANKIRPMSKYGTVREYENITSNYTLEKGQAYGKAGGSIQFTSGTEYEHTKASISDVSFVMVKAPSEASSLVQYVNENDTILKIAITDFPSTLTRYYIENVEGATHIYVTSATGTMELWKEVIE